MVATLVALLGSRSLLKWETRDEHEKEGEEEGAQDRGVERAVGSAMNVAIGGRCYSDHEDGCEC